MNTNSNWKNEFPWVSNKEFKDHSPPKIKEELEITVDYKDDDDDNGPYSPSAREADDPAPRPF